jgi:hypothetical protein
VSRAKVTLHEAQGVAATAGVKSVAFEARIIRADGTIEELGTIAYWHKNPVRRFLWRFSKGGRRR